MGKDRPHEATLTPLPGGGGWVAKTFPIRDFLVICLPISKKWNVRRRRKFLYIRYVYETGKQFWKEKNAVDFERNLHFWHRNHKKFRLRQGGGYQRTRLDPWGHALTAARICCSIVERPCLSILRTFLEQLGIFLRTSILPDN